MDTPEDIARIKSPSFHVFKDRYLLRQRPVILTDLMGHRPISRVKTILQARSALGHVPLTLQRGGPGGRFEYKDLLGRQPRLVLKELFGEPPSAQRFPQYCSLDEYLDLLRRVPATAAKAAKQELPAEVLELAGVPDYCRYNGAGRADDVVAFLYVANRGAVTQIHRDTDHRHSLLYQVFGLKRVILIPPASSKLIMPYGVQSLLTLQDIPDEERLRLLKFAGGYQCVLRPGETLYIPPLWWHFLEYASAAMSINFRFGRNPYNEFVATHLHPNMFIQGVAAKFLNLCEQPDRRALGAYRRLRQAYQRPARSPLKKYDRIQRVMEELHAEICPESLQGTWWFPLDRFFTMRDKRRVAAHFYGTRA